MATPAPHYNHQTREANATVEEDWLLVNRRLLAKSISELHYEECFDFSQLKSSYRLILNSGIVYEFSARVSVWGQYCIKPESILRNNQYIQSAAQFFIDAQTELELSDITLGNLLEECAQTLMGDAHAYHLRKGTSAADIVAMDVDQMQAFLDGHPKATLNKGRIGWGVNELHSYTPEANQPFQLRWAAVQKKLCKIGVTDEQLIQRTAQQSMNVNDWESISAQLVSLQSSSHFPSQHKNIQTDKEKSKDSGEWILIPIHPWQWQRYIQTHFQQWIASGQLIDLGVLGHKFLPLQSIRTLANVDNPLAPNIKLPITILNTSCYRGIPAQYIHIGAELSRWLQTLCQQDDLLKQRGTIVLEEPLGIAYQHPLYAQIEHAPYRYNEMLGVIWRDSVQAHLAQNERAMLVAALLQQDNEGNTVVAQLINESELSSTEWITHYFNAVVIPLYHLMCRYGIGLVAHGQNLTLITEQGIPKRLAIKDLQGDLRIVDQDFAELATLPDHIKNTLTKLPAEYLIHDLQTGHVVTVLRYFSALLEEKNILAESVFYERLFDAIESYKNEHSELTTRFQQFSLTDPIIKRLCINRVRFIQGYADTDQRPLPILGSAIANPVTMHLLKTDVKESTTQIQRHPPQRQEAIHL